MRTKEAILADIKRLKEELEIAEKELSVASSPKHGDYGVTMGGGRRIFLKVDGRLKAYRKDGAVAVSDVEDYLRNVEPEEYTILGNLFQDMTK